MRTIKRIGISSAFRVGFAVSAMAFLVIGFFAVLLPGLFGMSLIFGNNFGGSFLSALVIYVVGVTPPLTITTPAVIVSPTVELAPISASLDVSPVITATVPGTVTTTISE